jgi:ribokinase
VNTIEIVGLGALNIDHIYKVERLLEDGETTVLESSSFPGGSAANTIYGLAKLGMKTGFCGVVGDDDSGKMLLRDFQKAGVDTSKIRTKRGAKSGSVLCLSDNSGRRSLYVLPGANNQLTMADLDLAYINRVNMLHLSSFADDRQFKVVLELVARLKLSVKLSFAPGALYAVKGLKTLAPILRRTQLLFINQSEVRQLTGKDVITGAESCLKQGCQIVVVTLGTGTKIKKTTAVGYIRDSEHEYLIKPRDIGAGMDTTGAGDAFAAGFIYGVLKGKGLKDCGRLGEITAFFSTTKLGARHGFPRLKELAQRYQKLYSRQL